MTEITFLELLAKVSPECAAKVKGRIGPQGATHVVLFVNQALDSSAFGESSVLLVGGPDHTAICPEDCEGQHLNELPSQWQYPTHFAKVPSDNGSSGKDGT